MAIDLDKLSPELEVALERARLLAEQRQQAWITPLHMLYVLLDSDGPLTPTLERAGAATKALLETFATQLNSPETGQKLEPGKRAVASRSLRELIEKSFEKMAERRAETAEPIDFLLASLELGEANLSGNLRQAGITKQSIDQVTQSRASSGETLGGKRLLAWRARLATSWNALDGTSQLRQPPGSSCLS